MGTYIAMRVHPESEELIRQFMDENNIPVVYPKEERRRHITIMSTDSDFVDQYQPIPETQYYLTPNGFHFLPTKDGNNCLVLKVNCPTLTELHEWIKHTYQCEAHHGEFKPHISFSYDVGKDLRIEDLPPFVAPIIVSEEYVEPFNDNWAKRKDDDDSEN